MIYNLVDVEIRLAKAYSNQIDSWVTIVGGQISIIARSIINQMKDFTKYIFRWQNIYIAFKSSRNTQKNLILIEIFFSFSKHLANYGT